MWPTRSKVLPTIRGSPYSTKCRGILTNLCRSGTTSTFPLLAQLQYSLRRDISSDWTRTKWNVFNLRRSCVSSMIFIQSSCLCHWLAKIGRPIRECSLLFSLFSPIFSAYLGGGISPGLLIGCRCPFAPIGPSPPGRSVRNAPQVAVFFQVDPGISPSFSRGAGILSFILKMWLSTHTRPGNRKGTARQFTSLSFF